MWAWIFQIVLSIIIIWICHSLWNYFINSFSKQKSRDLLSIHTEKYKSIIQELTHHLEEKQQDTVTPEDIQMDLEQFMQELTLSSDNK